MKGKSKKAFGVGLGLLALLATGAAVNGQTVYDSITPWDGSTSVFSWGDPNTATYGQTFSVPQNGDEILTSFTFMVMDDGVPIDHLAAVYEWDSGTNRIVGSALFSEAGTTDGSGTFQPLNYTGHIVLDPNKTYVAFLSASDFFPTGGNGAWGQPQNQNFIPGGEFVFNNNGSDFDALFTTSWTTGWLGAGNDVAAEFIFIPAPGALALLGIAGLIGARRRRQ